MTAPALRQFWRRVRSIRALVLLVVLSLSVEIIVRRWYGGQLPTQVPAWGVLALIVNNLLVLLTIGKPLVAPPRHLGTAAATTKTEKS